MAGLRPFSCYRRIKRAYTRKSKYKAKGYVKAVPTLKITKFDMGDLQKKFEKELLLVSMEAKQIRQNALESARLVVLRKLEKALGKDFYLKLRPYPHHVLRENKMLSGAGADRMQQGMQLAFGRPVGTAAQIRKAQPIFTLRVNAQNFELAKTLLKSAAYRLPVKCTIVEN